MKQKAPYNDEYVPNKAPKITLSSMHARDSVTYS